MINDDRNFGGECDSACYSDDKVCDVTDFIYIKKPFDSQSAKVYIPHSCHVKKCNIISLSQLQQKKSKESYESPLSASHEKVSVGKMMMKVMMVMLNAPRNFTLRSLPIHKVPRYIYLTVVM